MLIVQTAKAQDTTMMKDSRKLAVACLRGGHLAHGDSNHTHTNLAFPHQRETKANIGQTNWPLVPDPSGISEKVTRRLEANAEEAD